MIDYTKELNQEQLEVVQNGDGACLVLAGAGSGKTRTIIYRVARLLEQGVQPSEILLVTFTNKAASEMNARILHLLGGQVRLPWSGTFHHIAFRILQEFAPLLGYKRNFTILDNEDSKDLLKLCLKQEGVDRTERRFPSTAVLFSLISFSRNAERSITEVLEEKYPNWSTLSDTIARIADEYARRKREANAMDFDDLLVNFYLLLLKSESTRLRFATQFRYVLVDEYQDTNTIQASIVRLLASVHKNILVVGDDAQSIYSFRAANIENILQFEKQYPGAKIFRLVTNYRSTPEILSLANDVIAHNTKQYHKELQSVRESFIRPEVRAFADAREEAQFVASRILELRDEGVKLPQMAVLFRAAFHSQALEVELVRRDIPYEYRGGVRFFERAHIKDVLAYVRVWHNVDDTVAWSRVLNMQTGIGPGTVEKILRLLKTPNTEITEISAVLPARAQVGWNDFLQIWQSLQASVPTPSALIQSVISSKYRDYLQSEYPDFRDRIQDIEELARYAEEEDDVNKFLAESVMQEGYRKASQSTGASRDNEQIILSTIHQAKGLEWEAVFVLHVAAGQFPSERSMSERNGLEEERRLFYVAITRARKHLSLSYPLMAGAMTFLGGPSMFLDEISAGLVDEHHLGGGTVFVDPSDDVDDVQYIPEDEPFSNKPPVRRSFLRDVSDL